MKPGCLSKSAKLLADFARYCEIKPRCPRFQSDGRCNREPDGKCEFENCPEAGGV